VRAKAVGDLEGACVEEGDADRARSLAARALRAGLDPLRVLEEGYTRALQGVGERWEAGDLFLPEMILAAEAMKAAMAVLQPKLREREGFAERSRRCVLGTVRGDSHDIGKHIVAALLEASGFEITDLGTDVEPARFVRALRETGAEYLGLSALLTTTMPEMKAVLDALREAGLRERVRVAIGGAPATQRYADEIGADGRRHADAGSRGGAGALHRDRDPASGRPRRLLPLPGLRACAHGRD
jgi:corrinoid protein of di/trimethylamine methyltransferase